MTPHSVESLQQQSLSDSRYREAATPELSLRQVSPTDRAGLDAVADLHMELLNFGPMAGLGRSFVREVCYRAHQEEGVLHVFLAEFDGTPAGLIAVTPYSLGFHRRGLRRHAGLAAWEVLKAIAARPQRIAGLLRALRMLASRRSEAVRGTDPMGEVVCIAVRPEFLTPRFVRATGLRLSELLLRRAAEYLRRAGVEQMRMVVDDDNRPVIMLYHRLGAQFSPYELGGEPQIEVRFNLRNGSLLMAVPPAEQFSPEPELPTIADGDPATR